ncbi:hypothetical protein [Pseudactinotalea sp. Z1748]|uniref:hypothetical protein n=1 Tax=Pseudactinotalea sp. Z1748 TaxID=3413027 RepID=UPI003C7B99AB
MPTPQELVAYLDQVPPAADQDGDWDVVALWAEGVPAQECADAGVTWLVESAWPTEVDRVDEMRRAINTALPR